MSIFRKSTDEKATDENRKHPAIPKYNTGPISKNPWEREIHSGFISLIRPFFDCVLAVNVRKFSQPKRPRPGAPTNPKLFWNRFPPQSHSNKNSAWGNDEWNLGASSVGKLLPVPFLLSRCRWWFPMPCPFRFFSRIPWDSEKAECIGFRDSWFLFPRL